MILIPIHLSICLPLCRFMLIQGKAVSDKVPMLFELFAEVLLEARLDNQQRAVEMLKESKARKEASILSSGHSYAATRLAGRSSFLGYLNECTGGLTSVRRAESLLKQATDDWPTLSARLEKMRRQIVRTGKDALIINLTGNQQLLDEVLPLRAGLCLHGCCRQRAGGGARPPPEHCRSLERTEEAATHAE